MGWCNRNQEHWICKKTYVLYHFLNKGTLISIYILEAYLDWSIKYGTWSLLSIKSLQKVFQNLQVQVLGMVGLFIRNVLALKEYAIKTKPLTIKKKTNKQKNKQLHGLTREGSHICPLFCIGNNDNLNRTNVNYLRPYPSPFLYRLPLGRNVSMHFQTSMSLK